MHNKKPKVVRIDRGATVANMDLEAKEIVKMGGVLVSAESSNEEDTIKAGEDADVIITAAAQITRHVMEKLTNLKAIVRYGIGYDTIDVPAATDNGVVVVNIPDFCWEEVSNHAIVLMLALAKKLVPINNAVKNESWSAGSRLIRPMVSIYDQTLGIVGCGNIGRRVARKAQCFGMTTIGYDPYVHQKLAREYGIKLVSNLHEMLKQCDFVSINPLLNDETLHMIGEREFEQMKPTAYIVNTARGPVIDEKAMVKALNEKWIAGAGIDVFEQEPSPPENPLFKMDNVIVTPHSAAYSEVSWGRLRVSVGSEAARIIAGKWPKNIVNKGVKPKVKLIKGD